jgi:sialate O-acetylesterase
MRTYFQLLAFTLCVVTANAEVAMPKFFSDNMVLQRDVLIPIWGWANPNEAITVKFHDQSKITTADSKGNWMLKLDVEKAGGPFQLIIPVRTLFK